MRVTVSPSFRREIARHFLDPIIVYHEGGHYIPQNGEIKEKIYQFLLQFLDLEWGVCTKECSVRGSNP